MIVKDEEEVLARCLESIKDIVDEIIIVDTGSSDKTKEIAKKYTNKIYDFKWCDDFSKARNYSFFHATKEYILWLDADDVILDKDKKEFLKLKNTLDKNVDIVMMKYNLSYDENGNPKFSYNRERLLKNNKKYKWIGEVHEVIVPSGNIIYSDIAISHKKEKKEYTKRNLNIFKKMLQNGKKLDARQQFYYARELYYHGMYEEAIEEFNIFFNRKDSWIENKISACTELYNCYLALNDEENSLKALIKSFTFDLPRASICCNIAKHFYLKNEYNVAIFWYDLATKLKPNINSGGFEELEYYDYVPYLGLCVCYDKIKKYTIANEYNEKVGKIRPNDKKYLYNKKYFENLLNIDTKS
jgi:glycosyltransferase involved in cell wall biosynthesis